MIVFEITCWAMIGLLVANMAYSVFLVIRRPKPIIGWCNKCGYCGPVKKDFRGLLIHPGCNYTAVEVRD